MKKIDDRIMLGVATGIIGSLPFRFINNLENKLGLTDLRYSERAGSIFTRGKKSRSLPVNQIMGRFINDFMVASTGVGTSYLLSLTGRDYSIVKGIGVATSQWLFLTTLLHAAGITAKSKTRWGEALFLLDHLVYGALVGVLVGKFGDESLFPDSKDSGQFKEINIKTYRRKPPVISYKGTF